jgi:hypothetical protein
VEGQTYNLDYCGEVGDDLGMPVRKSMEGSEEVSTV